MHSAPPSENGFIRPTCKSSADSAYRRDVADTRDRFAVFEQLHARQGAFVIPNVWDAGSARIVTSLGFEALATTSAGYAFSAGKRDSLRGLSRSEIIENASAIVEATHLPVSCDLEDGFGPSPADCAETIAIASAAGLVGGTIEDATGDPTDPIFDFGLAVDRIAAAADAARGLPFVLTARSENFLWGRPDLADTIARLQAFERAGAHVLYAPGLRSLDDIRAVCESVERPVNVVMGLVGLDATVDDLASAGVRRISVGGSLARAALGALVAAVTEIRDFGTFRYADRALSDAEASSYMRLTVR
jgi:2-methylisocitrate lyase-like PEP mutase family enzyme